LISAQHRLGQQILVVTSPLQQVDSPASVDAVVDGVQYFRTPVAGRIARLALSSRWPILREWYTVRLLRKRILQLIRLHNIDVIYAHSPALCGFAALQAARAKGLPFIYEIRAFWEDAAVDQQRTTKSSLRYRAMRGLETYVSRRADAIAAIAQPILQDLASRDISTTKMFCVPNGVDAQGFSPMPRDPELAAHLGLTGAPVMGFFGSLYRYEGISWLMQAVARLRSRGISLQVLVIGRGEEEQAIRAAIRNHNLADVVRLIDHVPHDQIKRYYSVADIMVFPRISIRLTELVTPIKPLEAMALGKPVLASNVGGHRELVEHDYNGLLFRPEDVDDFGFQAMRLIADPGFRERIRKCAREFVEQKKDWSTLAREYGRIYEFALVNRRISARLIPQTAK
jgi:PEP-CTERM/exosortase A-associated glycosyltransferase